MKSKLVHSKQRNNQIKASATKPQWFRQKNTSGIWTSVSSTTRFWMSRFKYRFRYYYFPSAWMSAACSSAISSILKSTPKSYPVHLKTGETLIRFKFGEQRYLKFSGLPMSSLKSLDALLKSLTVWTQLAWTTYKMPRGFTRTSLNWHLRIIAGIASAP